MRKGTCLIGMDVKVVPVQEVEREGESEPDADEGELLDRIRQKVIDNLDS